MEVKDSHIEIFAKTKKDRCLLPTFTECELRLEIGVYGFAEIVVTQKPGNGSQCGDYGRVARISLHNVADMERVGKALIALANAVREIDGSNAKVTGSPALSASPSGLPG